MNLGSIWGKLSKDDRKCILELFDSDRPGIMSFAVGEWLNKHGNIYKNKNYGKLIFVGLNTIEDCLKYELRYSYNMNIDNNEQIKQYIRILKYVNDAKGVPK